MIVLMGCTIDYIDKQLVAGSSPAFSQQCDKVAQLVEQLGLYSLLSFDTFPHFFVF
jgi:hypothetical protein